MTQVILNVVRGLEHWTVLKKLGVWRNGETWNFGLYNNPVEITVDDIVLGFQKYASHEADLREWATLVLCADNLTSFDTDTDPRFDDVVGALWDASFGEKVDMKKLEALINV